MWKMFVLNDNKEAFALLRTERAVNKWRTDLHLLAEEMKTFKRTVHNVEVTRHSFLTVCLLCVCTMNVNDSIKNVWYLLQLDTTDLTSRA